MFRLEKKWRRGWDSPPIRRKKLLSRLSFRAGTLQRYFPQYIARYCSPESPCRQSLPSDRQGQFARATAVGHHVAATGSNFRQPLQWARCGGGKGPEAGSRVAVEQGERRSSPPAAPSPKLHRFMRGNSDSCRFRLHVSRAADLLPLNDIAAPISRRFFRNQQEVKGALPVFPLDERMLQKSRPRG